VARTHPTGFLTHSATMSSPHRLVFLLALSAAVALSGCSSEPAIDAEFPPGNPVLGDEAADDPVAGSDGGGDSTDYVLLAVLAVCLIGAGTLLVRVERWERNRSRGGT